MNPFPFQRNSFYKSEQLSEKASLPFFHRCFFYFRNSKSYLNKHNNQILNNLRRNYVFQNGIFKNGSGKGLE